MRVVITGSRKWADYLPIWSEISQLPPDTTVVHGGCPSGADAIAHRCAKSAGLQVEVYPADWRAHGKAAGPIRNRQMIDSKPDLVIAFVTAESRGTQDCINAAIAAGVPVKIKHEGDPDV